MLLQAQQRQQRIFEKHGEKKQSLPGTNRGRSSTYKSFESEKDSIIPVKPKKISEMTIEQFLINKERKELELEKRSQS